MFNGAARGKRLCSSKEAGRARQEIHIWVNDNDFPRYFRFNVCDDSTIIFVVCRLTSCLSKSFRSNLPHSRAFHCSSPRFLFVATRSCFALTQRLELFNIKSASMNLNFAFRLNLRFSCANRLPNKCIFFVFLLRNQKQGFVQS